MLLNKMGLPRSESRSNLSRKLTTNIIEHPGPKVHEPTSSRVTQNMHGKPTIKLLVTTNTPQSTLEPLSTDSTNPKPSMGSKQDLPSGTATLSQCPNHPPEPSNNTTTTGTLFVSGITSPDLPLNNFSSNRSHTPNIVLNPTKSGHRLTSYPTRGISKPELTDSKPRQHLYDSVSRVCRTKKYHKRCSLLGKHTENHTLQLPPKCKQTIPDNQNHSPPRTPTE